MKSLCGITLNATNAWSSDGGSAYIRLPENKIIYCSDQSPLLYNEINTYNGALLAFLNQTAYKI